MALETIEHIYAGSMITTPWRGVFPAARRPRPATARIVVPPPLPPPLLPPLPPLPPGCPGLRRGCSHGGGRPRVPGYSSSNNNNNDDDDDDDDDDKDEGNGGGDRSLENQARATGSRACSGSGAVTRRTK
ncbi:hypothetical protein MY4824_001502 [Beauveria thailandica]